MSGTKKDVRDIEPKQFRKNPVNETLKTAWDFSRHLIDSSLDMIVAVDQDRRIVEFNKAAQEAFGYRPEEILGRPVDVLYADMEESREVSLEVARNGSLVREITNIRKNGEPFPCLLSAAMIRDENGRVIGVVGNSRDETERKRAAEALQNYSKRLGELVETRTTALKTANEELHREIAERRRTETALREAEVRLIRHRDELEDAVAQRTLELEEKNHALQVQAQKLSEMNAALGILFEQRDTDRQELEKTLMQNIRSLVWPYLERLKNGRLPEPLKADLEIGMSNLRNLMTSFSSVLAAKYVNLSSREIQVANLVRDGFSSKDIAELLHISTRSAERHRDNIRRKMGLRNKKVNLRSYLFSLK